MTAVTPSPIRLRSRTGAALITATVLASMAGFLDASVVNVAIPAIGRDLGAGVVALQWTLTGYLLTAAALLLVAGAFADKFGRRHVLILPAILLWGVGLGLTVTPLTAAVLAAVGDGDLGEASAISDVASRLGGAVLTALVPLLIGVRAGRGLGQALVDGYRPAMIVLAALCAAAAVISAGYVRGARRAAPAPARFAPPAPFHGCALPVVHTSEAPS